MLTQHAHICTDTHITRHLSRARDISLLAAAHARDTSAQLLPVECTLLVRIEEGLHTLCRQLGSGCDVVTAVVRDVKQQQLRLTFHLAQFGQLAHLRHSTLAHLGREPEHVTAGRLRCLSERREDRERRVLRRLVAAVEHQAERGLLVDAVRAREVGHGGGHPRELRALRVGHDATARVGVDRGARFGVDRDEGRDALHLEELA
mmetsp:Transcript_22378/g.50544  ORF Transcript_22378/g.50544 Transcript_22378/m.50544 type:complete len:204 (-) Transcript_22378:776-1387(-)